MKSFPNGSANVMNSLSPETVRLFDDALATIKTPPQLTAREARLCVILNIPALFLEALLVMDAKVEAVGDRARELRAEREAGKREPANPPEGALPN